MANSALLGALLLAGVAAAAAPPEVLGPRGFVSPDGFEVAVRPPEATLAVEGADATRTERGFFVVPRSAAREVKLKAQAGGLVDSGLA